MFTDLLGFGAVFVVCGGLLWMANHIEPHWVARDGSRFLTTAQELDQFGLPMGRRREVRVRIDEEAEALLISRRSLLRPSQGIWVVDAKAPDPPRNKTVTCCKEMTGSETNRIALRMPSDSKVVPRSSTPSSPSPAPTCSASASCRGMRAQRQAGKPTSRCRLRKLPMLQEVRQRTHQLIEVDQEGVVAVRRVDLDVARTAVPARPSSSTIWRCW